MHRRGEPGSIVSLLCDRGERYDRTLYEPAWLARSGIDPAPWERRLRAVAEGDGTQADGSPQSSLAAALPISEEHTSELQSLMRISYAVFCLKKKNKKHNTTLICVDIQYQYH